MLSLEPVLAQIATVHCTDSSTQNSHEFLARCARPSFWADLISSIVTSSSSSQVSVSPVVQLVRILDLKKMTSWKPTLLLIRPGIGRNPGLAHQARSFELNYLCSVLSRSVLTLVRGWAHSLTRCHWLDYVPEVCQVKSDCKTRTIKITILGSQEPLPFFNVIDQSCSWAWLFHGS